MHPKLLLTGGRLRLGLGAVHEFAVEEAGGGVGSVDGGGEVGRRAGRSGGVVVGVRHRDGTAGAS